MRVWFVANETGLDGPYDGQTKLMCWVSLLAVTGALFSFALVCAMPFLSLSAFARLTLQWCYALLSISAVKSPPTFA